MPLIAGDATATTGMAAAIFSSWLAGGSVIDNVASREFAYRTAAGVITYLQASATVLPLLLVAPPGGGPVTGTGTIT